MTKIGFNPKAFSTAAPHGGDVRHAFSGCSFEPVVVPDTGVEAIKEGLRLANIEGFVRPPKQGGSHLPAEDIDS